MKRITAFILSILFIFTLVACNGGVSPTVPTTTPSSVPSATEEVDLFKLYPKQDIYYQIFVRSFADSDGDGIGDLKGITSKLSYLETLGVTSLWLTPIHPTLTYHGYEVGDYYAINPEFGTMEDLEELITKAKAKGIKIMLDMVFNHTWEYHDWYQEALYDLDSPYREYYIWPPGAAAGVKGRESFPFSRDLNLRSPALKEELSNVLRFYLEKGVAGFRFDAVKHYFEKPFDNEYSSNASFEGGKFLKDLKDSVKDDYPNVYFVGEYFEYSVSPYNDFYMGSDSMFDFEISRMFQNGNYGNMASSLTRIYRDLDGFNPNFIDAPFIINHDLNRYASMHQNLVSQKLAASILLTLPGNPFIYYGEELGMKGVRMEGGTVDGYVDSSGKKITVYDEPRRQPFLWDSNDSAVTTWFPLINGNDQVDKYSTQLNDPNSLLNHYMTLINLRKNNPALMFTNSYKDEKIGGTVSFTRTFEYGDIYQKVLIVHNYQNDTKNIDTLGYNILEVLFGSVELGPFQSLIAVIE